MRKKGKWLLRKHTSCLTGDGDGDDDGEGDGGGEGEGDDDGDGDGEVANDESSKKNIVHDHIIQKIASLFIYYFILSWFRLIYCPFGLFFGLTLIVLLEKAFWHNYLVFV